MKEQLQQIKSRALAQMQEAADLSALDAVRVGVLGKKGELTAVLKLMGKLSAEERPVMGQLANSVRNGGAILFLTTLTRVLLPITSPPCFKDSTLLTSRRTDE